MRYLATLCALCATAAAAEPYAPAATVLADRLTACSFSPALGIFVGEQLWQSGATLETVGNALLAHPPPRLQAALLQLLNASFARTPVIVDNCLCVRPSPLRSLAILLWPSDAPPLFPPRRPMQRRPPVVGPGLGARLHCHGHPRLPAARRCRV